MGLYGLRIVRSAQDTVARPGLLVQISHSRSRPGTLDGFFSFFSTYIKIKIVKDRPQNKSKEDTMLSD